MHGDDSRKFLLFKAPTIWEVGKIIYECCLYAVNGNLGKARCGGSCIRRRKISSNIDRKSQNYAQQAMWCQREFFIPLSSIHNSTGLPNWTYFTFALQGEGHGCSESLLRVKKEKRRAPHLYPLPLTMGERGILNLTHRYLKAESKPCTHGLLITAIAKASCKT